jgi:hypothetical protein
MREIVLTIKQGPHDGWWVMDGEKILVWCYCKELAETRLKDLEEGK